MQNQSVFKRYEKKYLLSAAQYRYLESKIAGQRLQRRLCPDAFSRSAISNIYFDTPDRYLIRRSLEKPNYKEKLRLRSYRVPKAGDESFIELKKKFDGVVYKRRICLPVEEAECFLYDQLHPEEPDQVTAEVLWMLKTYGSIVPSMYIYYDRIALKGVEDAELRITFDTNIRWREDNLRLAAGTHGQYLLPKGQVLMEIKVAGAMPLWLTHILNEGKIYPTSFSKYGTAHLASLHQNTPLKEYSHA